MSRTPSAASHHPSTLLQRADQGAWHGSVCLKIRNGLFTKAPTSARRSAARMCIWAEPSNAGVRTSCMNCMKRQGLGLQWHGSAVTVNLSSNADYNNSHNKAKEIGHLAGPYLHTPDETALTTQASYEWASCKQTAGRVMSCEYEFGSFRTVRSNTCNKRGMLYASIYIYTHESVIKYCDNSCYSFSFCSCCYYSQSHSHSYVELTAGLSNTVKEPKITQRALALHEAPQHFQDPKGPVMLGTRLLHNHPTEEPVAPRFQVHVGDP